MEKEIQIGICIKKILLERERSVAWLAKQIDYDRSDLNAMLNKKSDIRMSILYKISVVLKFDFFALYSKQLNDNQSISDES
ncbi:MAG: hypothetical protein LBR36_00160 [Bacteroidales bacterium]|jgi:DNA-binding Xre family transcriptional regulator|nr:hypothetical protein [Bacteroidales bacterium]